jgi:uncharacterized membrane protein
MGEHRVDALSVALYAGDMFVCCLAAMVLRFAMIRENPSDDPAIRAMNRAGARKNALSLLFYGAAVPLAAFSAALALALVFATAAAYVLPSVGLRRRAAA